MSPGRSAGSPLDGIVTIDRTSVYADLWQQGSTLCRDNNNEYTKACMHVRSLYSADPLMHTQKKFINQLTLVAKKCVLVWINVAYH